MAPHIDSITGPHGSDGAGYVTLRGDLGAATRVLWGDTEIGYEEWDQEDYGNYTDLDIKLPDGSGTVKVVAFADDEKSNEVEYTYE
ncbi:hypothetical protein [Kitasatospora sp. NPDC018619]|uniref:hypothetical protein n=1 Tax=unclassified Kitasatospora TaxID=2633591 RepID=UPI00378B7062